MAYNRHFGYKYSRFGEDTKGHDLKAFGDTTGKYIFWDASADTFYIVGTLSLDGSFSADDILLIDNETLTFGTGSDVVIKWDATNLVISAAADDSLIEIGDSAVTQKSFDLKWYANEASGASYLYFDADVNLIYTTGVDLQFKDNDVLVFGTGSGATGDVGIKYDTNSLNITPTAVSDALEIGAAGYVLNTTLHGTFTVGVDGTGYDVKLFSATASHYWLWDEDADTNIIIGKFRQGTFSSTAAVTGNALHRANNTAQARFYSDDGGAALTGSGSVPDIRGTLSRTLITQDNTGGDVRLWGLMGQLKSYDGFWNDEQVGAVHGRLEIVRNAATVTLGGYGITAAVVGNVSTSGTITVNTNHVLAGLAAISDIRATLTQTGITAGVYVGKYNTAQWSDATTRYNWKYGLYIDEDSVDYCPIAVGEFVASAASGGGFAVTLTNSAAMRVYAETTADLTSAAMVRSILGRMLVTGDFTQTAECFGTVGQLVVKNTKMQHDGAGVLGSFEVQTTAATISGDIGDHCIAGVLGRVGVSITATTVEADGILAGVAAMSNITDGYVTVTTGGVLAGVYVGRFDAKQKWDYGLNIAQGGVTRGISVGKYSSTVDDGLDQSGATWLNGFFADDSGENLTGVRRNLIARTLFTVDQSTASADYSVIRGHLKAASGVDFSGDTSFRNAVHGYVEMAGATICGAGAFFSGVCGELWGDGNITGTGLIGALMARIYTSAGTVSGTVAGLVVCKQFSSTQTFTHGIYIQDDSVAVGNDIRLMGGATVSSGSIAPTHSATQGSLYLRTGQGVNAALYLNTNGSTGWTLLNSVQA